MGLIEVQEMGSNLKEIQQNSSITIYLKSLSQNLLKNPCQNSKISS